MPKTQLTIALLSSEAKVFAAAESTHDEPILYGVTDGKAVGTYLELKFRKYLADRTSSSRAMPLRGSTSLRSAWT